uniref:hypothetical protein n=1 Tax=Klebsiella pneumoniae TaxID=573 RepID=UPI0022BA03B2
FVILDVPSNDIEDIRPLLPALAIALQVYNRSNWFVLAVDRLQIKIKRPLDVPPHAARQRTWLGLDTGGACQTIAEKAQ